MPPTERAHERIHQRYAMALEVRVTLADGTEQIGRSRDLGLGGMRLLTTPPLAFGSTVTLRFRLPALAQDSEVESIVRWVDEAGAGLQFGSLRARDVWALNQLFRGK